MCVAHCLAFGGVKRTVSSTQSRKCFNPAVRSFASRASQCNGSKVLSNEGLDSWCHSKRREPCLRDPGGSVSSVNFLRFANQQIIHAIRVRPAKPRALHVQSMRACNYRSLIFLPSVTHTGALARKSSFCQRNFQWLETPSDTAGATKSQVIRSDTGGLNHGSGSSKRSDD